MPADDGLHRMSTEDLAAFLRRLRALRVREGLSSDGLAAQAGLPPDGDTASQAGFTITRLGPRLAPRHRPGRGRWRPSPGLVGVTATAMVLAGLAAGGAVLMEPAGHSQSSAPSAPSPGGGRSMANHGGRMHTRTLPPAPAPASPRPAPPRPRRAAPPGRVRVVVPVLVRPARMGTEVAGVGCPGRPEDGISLAAAASGPGWAAAGGGWTGNGCDGSSVWTMDPTGNQASPSTLTWFFYPSRRASSCQLAVFVPSQNAFGVGNYQISAGADSLGHASIDQAGSGGQWVPLGSYPAAGGTLAVQLQPGTAALTAATGGHGGNGSGNGNGGGKGGGTGPGSTGPGGTGPGGPGTGPPTPAPTAAPGRAAAVAASAARASCH